MTAKPELKLEDFPNRTYGKTRRGAAAENHVNNVVYPDFYDTGLTAIAHDPVLLEGGNGRQGNLKTWPIERSRASR